jgi:hypothetical protein
MHTPSKAADPRIQHRLFCAALHHYPRNFRTDFGQKAVTKEPHRAIMAQEPGD